MQNLENPEDIEQLNQMDPVALQSLLGGTEGASLIPESLVTAMIAGFVVLNVIAFLFFVFYVIGLIRKWKVESAVFHMQKDLADIKAQLVSAKPTPTPKPVTKEVDTPEPRPSASDDATA